MSSIMKYVGKTDKAKVGMSKKKLLISTVVAFTVLSASIVVGFEEYYRLSYAKDLEAMQTMYSQEYKGKEDVINQRLAEAQKSVDELEIKIENVTTEKEQAVSLSASKQSKLYARSQVLEEEKATLEKQIKTLKQDKNVLQQKVSRLYQDRLELKRTKLLEATKTTIIESSSAEPSSGTNLVSSSSSTAVATPTVIKGMKKVRPYTVGQKVADKPVPEDAIQVKATSYTAECEGCIGITKSGIDIRTKTPNIIAVDPTVIPMGSVVDVWVGSKYYGRFDAEDIGGGIKGAEIDVLRATEVEANDFGVKTAFVKVVN